MAFNAGAITSTMETNRRPFAQGLKQARKDLRDFSRQRAVATVDVDTSRASQRLRELRGQMRNLGALSRHISVSADTGGAASQLAALQAQTQAFGASGGDARVGVDTAGAGARVAALQAQVATLQQQLEKLDRTRAAPRVSLSGAGAATGKVALLRTALVGLGPAVVPVLATVTGQAVALAGALGAAGAATGVFGVAVVGVVKPLTDYRAQMEQLNAAIEAAEPGSEQLNTLLAERAELMESLTGPQQAVLDSWDALKESFMAFGAPAQTQILGTLTNLLVGARLALEALQPAVVPVSEAFLTLSERFRAAMGGPGMAAFTQWVATKGPSAVLWLAQTLVNLGATVGALVTAFAPLTDQMVSAEGSFSRLRAWAEGLAVNPQFQEFLAYVQVNGPLVWSTLGSLANALIQIGWALAPLAPPILSLVTAVAGFTAQVASAHPWVIQLAWGALLLSRVWGPLAAGMNLVKVALQSQAAAWLLAKSRMIAYNVAMKAVRAATLLWTAAQWLLNVALSANPIALIVIAIVAAVALIVGAVVYAWNNFDWFRNGVLAVWEAIKTGAMWLWTNGIEPVVTWIVNAFNTYLLPAIQFVAGMFSFYFNLIWTVIKTVWSFIWPIIQFIALVAFALVVTALGLLWSYWKFVFNAIAAIVMWLWNNVVKPVIDWIVAGWNDYLVPALQWAQAQWSKLMALLGAAVRWLWDTFVSPVVNWISAKWAWLVAKFNYYKTLISLAFDLIGGYIDLLRDRFELGIDRIKEFVAGLIDNLGGLRDAAKEIFEKLANHARKPINWVINTVYNDGIRKVSRSVLNAVGMEELANKIPKADTIPAFAGGGPVMDPSGFVRGRGSGTSDDITARIANREFVVNARSTARWRPVLEWINNQGRRNTGRTLSPDGVPGFAEGGFVGPLEWAAGAVLGASKQALQGALDALGWSGWVSDLKKGAPVWEGAAGGALDMVADGLLNFLGKEDAKGGGPMAVVKNAQKHVGKSGNPNEFTEAFGMNGLAWCAMFVSEMIRAAKAQKLYHNTRSAAVMDFAAAPFKRVSAARAKPGDLAGYRTGSGPGGWSHINIVENPQQRTSIGGNESNAVRRQVGYYARASQIWRPGLAQGGLLDWAQLRAVMGQDYAVNNRRTTPEDLQFYRVLAGLPAYQAGGTAEGPSLVGETGPELVEFGAKARVRSAPDTAEVLAEAIVRAMERREGADGSGGPGRTVGGVTINGLATVEVLRRLMHELAVDQARETGSTGRAGAPGRTQVGV